LYQEYAHLLLYRSVTADAAAAAAGINAPAYVTAAAAS
jgi:hypothetical protein